MQQRCAQRTGQRDTRPSGGQCDGRQRAVVAEQAGCAGAGRASVRAAGREQQGRAEQGAEQA
ncbi:hypothetical protein, partial [Burkholderia gladioli]|uniref:hypothetical protein n=1 Tax=Burkholderia gladioli TaxID=28095 RepID=UPI0020B8D551